MNDVEVEADVRRDTTWNRPTWRLGGNGTFRPDRVNDPFGVFGGAGAANAGLGGGPTGSVPSGSEGFSASLMAGWLLKRWVPTGQRGSLHPAGD